MARKEYAGAAVPTTLATAMTATVPASGGTFNVADATGWPTGVYPFVVNIARGTTAEEKILCSARTGTTITVSVRGFDGTTAKVHAGSNVETAWHTIDAESFTESSAHLYDTTRNDHTQYALLSGATFTGSVAVGGTLTAGAASFGTVAASTSFAQAASSGVAGTFARSDHVHGTPATPVTSAVAGTGITVSAATGAVTITNSAPQTFASPTVILGTAAGAGVATSALRSDATIVAFDAAAPTTIAFGAAAAVGSAAVAARRDHIHGMPALTTVAGAWGQYETHASLTDMNAPPDWGGRFFNATAASSPTGAAAQFYSEAHALGSNYAITSYAMQRATPRNVATPYEYVRYREAGAWTAWTKLSAGYADSAGGLASGGFGTPGIVLGTAAGAGSATTALRSDATIVAFDATAPAALAFGGAAVVGTAAIAARRDHAHAMPATPVTSAVAGTGISVSAATGAVTIGNTGVTSVAAGTNVTVSAATGAVTINSTPPFDATVPALVALATTTSAVGAATTVARRDHSHGVSGILPVASGGTGSATQNFVDLTTAQTIAGNKTFSNSVFTNGSTISTRSENLALRAGYGVTGGGTVTWTGAALGWTARLIVISHGRGAEFSTAGYYDITVPADGTVITGVGGAANQTVASGRIPIPVWNALYYILPIGSTNASVAANFRVANYTADFIPPPEWLLIAVHNNDSAALRFCTGATLKANYTLSVGEAIPFGATTAQTSFGLAAGAGTSGQAARTDHTHGTPATPVTSAVAGTGIGVSAATGAVTFTNTGVTSIVAGTNITISGGTGAVTINSTAAGATYAIPAVVLGTAAAEGVATTGIRSDATIVAFDVTAPPLVGLATTASTVGTVAMAARRDHNHGVTGILPVGNGGTGSSTQNFVDLSTAQSIAGAKTFSSIITANGGINSSGTSTRDKIRVWSTAQYTIGMQTGFTYGFLANDYAMTFQMNNAAGRGFWWGHDAHTQAQGAMSLTTDGRLHVGQFVSIGGMTGATAASRSVGATTGGAPASGTFAVGDSIVDHKGLMWVCTVAGTPGKWRDTSHDVMARQMMEVI